MRLAVDEWGIVRNWDPSPDAPGVGSFEHYYTLGDAIAVGRGLHELIRASDVVAMANWTQIVNVLGAIKTSHNDAVLDPVGHVLALYRAHLQGQVLPDAISDAPAIDAIASWDQQNQTVSLALINFSPKSEVASRVAISGTARTESVQAWRITGTALTASNLPGAPEAVTTTRLAEIDLSLYPMPLPPLSLTVIRWTIPAP